jgi:hypothetical protein
MKASVASLASSLFKSSGKIALEFQKRVRDVSSKTERGLLYTVDQMRDRWRCDCIAGQMKQPCRHIRIAQNNLDGQKYRPITGEGIG